jgi:hypothetical protein
MATYKGTTLAGTFIVEDGIKDRRIKAENRFDQWWMNRLWIDKKCL